MVVENWLRREMGCEGSTDEAVSIGIWRRSFGREVLACEESVEEKVECGKDTPV